MTRVCCVGPRYPLEFFGTCHSGPSSTHPSFRLRFPEFYFFTLLRPDPTSSCRYPLLSCVGSRIFTHSPLFFFKVLFCTVVISVPTNFRSVIGPILSRYLRTQDDPYRDQTETLDPRFETSLFHLRWVLW